MIIISYYNLIKIFYKLTHFIPFLKNNKIKPIDFNPSYDLTIDINPSPDLTININPSPDLTCDICLNLHKIDERITIDCKSNVPHYVCEMCYLKIINTNALCPYCRNDIFYDNRDVIRMLLKSKYDGLDFKNNMLKEHFDTYDISLDDSCKNDCIIIVCLIMIILFGYGIYLQIIKNSSQ